MKTKKILFLLLIASLFSGCIKENMDDCRRSFTLLFRYDGDGTTDIFRQKVSKVDLYVYNAETGELVLTRVADQAALGQLQGIRLDELEPGNYEAVCWGNVFDDSRMMAFDSKETGQIAAPNFYSGTDIFTNDELYYAAKSFTVTGAWKEQEDICIFQCSHIDVTVRLEGFQGAVYPWTRAGSDCPVDLNLAELPAFCDFYGHPSSEKETYVLDINTAEDDPTAYESRFSVLRFGDRNDAKLQLMKPGTDNIFYTLGIQQFLEENNISVEDHQEVSLDILLKLSSDGAHISVKPFEIEDIHPGLDERNK